MGNKLFVAALLVAPTMALCQNGAGGYAPPTFPGTYGSSAAGLTPPTFTCPNDGTTGTTAGLLVKLSASNTCISTTTGDATATGGTPFVGICYANCGTTGSAQIVPFGPVVPCTFDNSTTFGHSASISTATAGNCSDLGAVSDTNGGSQILTLGRILDTGAAGTHNVLLQPVQNALSTVSMGPNIRMNSGFTGQLMLREANAAAGVFLEFGGQTSTHPCLGDSGLLLQVLGAGASGCTGVAALGVDHAVALASTAPAVASGFGMSPSITSGGDSFFVVNVGTGGAATSGVINFGTAWTTAPACIAEDTTSAILQRATATASQVTVTSSSAWSASDKVAVHCEGQGGL